MSGPEVEVADALAVLAHGALEVEGRLAGASNATLYCTAEADGLTLTCVYKPVAGERPLWDFPDRTLGHREVATWLMVDHAARTALDVAGHVPPTAWRDDGPFGPGSCQLWIDTEDDADAELVDVLPPREVRKGWRSILRALGDDGRPLVLVHADTPALRRMALLDAIANNSDRKGGHILAGVDGTTYGIDHGLCFNLDDKLRTVLWGWAGEPLDDTERALLRRLTHDLLSGPLHRSLLDHLSPGELEVTAERAAALLARGAFDHPSEGWPAIPWPAF